VSADRPFTFRVVRGRDRAGRYLVDGNVGAARAFVAAFVVAILAARPQLATAHTASVPRAGDAATDDVTITTDGALNWAQLAVQTCQRAQGAENKLVREAWIRLCGTYQARGGLLAQPPVRQVCVPPSSNSHSMLTVRDGQALQEISTLYFGLPPPRQAAANPFGDMLSSMFGGGGGSAPAAPRRLAPPPASGLD
jgi:hypothetical protein